MEALDFRNKRQRLGFTQAQMGQRLGFSRVHVGLMERGQAPITDRTAELVDAMRPPPLEREASAHDPLERILEQALIDAGIRYQLETERSHDHGLDFHLPDHDIAIEVKAMHTPRVERQLERYRDVILLQGRKSVEAFAHLIRCGVFPFPDLVERDD